MECSEPLGDYGDAVAIQDDQHSPSEVPFGTRNSLGRYCLSTLLSKMIVVNVQSTFYTTHVSRQGYSASKINRTNSELI